MKWPFVLIYEGSRARQIGFRRQRENSKTTAKTLWLFTVARGTEPYDFYWLKKL